MFVENKEKIYCQFDERLRASYTNSTQVNTPMSEHVVFYSFSNFNWGKATNVGACGVLLFL